MFHSLILFSSLVAVNSVFASHLPRATPNDGVHLAVGPNCGSLSGVPADVNSGLLPIAQYKTIIAFGDSFTDGGVRDGGPRKPPVVIPPNPTAGGRLTDGPVWVEDLGMDTGALVKDYAVSGAVTDAKLWASAATASDFVTQVSLFLSQSNQLDPKTTLYSAFFGINDVGASHKDGTANLPVAAQTIVDQIRRLTQPPTNARSFLILDDYGRGAQSAAGDAFKQKYFSGLQELQSSIPDFLVAFVDFKTIWDGVMGTTPGFRAFGYTTSGACAVSGTTTVGACGDPAHAFYWLPGHPSNETHRIMADYVEIVLKQCASVPDLQ